MKLKQGDMVQVIAGKDRGKQGKILKVDRATDKVFVEGVNLAKKHQKPRSAQQPGEIIEKSMPVDASNVMLVCPQTKQPTRVGYRIEDGEKIRISKRSGQPIDA